MKIQETETSEGTPEAATDAPPRKALLGKRVLRHFNVKTSIQTGRLSTASDTEEDPGTYSMGSRRTQQ